MKRRHSFSRMPGFTLVELMAVIVILAVLAGVAVAEYADMVDSARRGAAQGAVAAGRSVLSMAYADEFLADRKPPAAADLIAAATATGVQSDHQVEFGGPDGAGDITITVTVDGTEIVETWSMP